MDIFMLNKTICRLPDVMARTGLSRSTIYELVSRGEFPSQISLGPRTVGWVENEISDWIESRIDKSRAREYPTARKKIGLVN
jgi:prophage regulatory protein